MERRPDFSPRAFLALTFFLSGLTAGSTCAHANFFEDLGDALGKAADGVNDLFTKKEAQDQNDNSHTQQAHTTAAQQTPEKQQEDDVFVVARPKPGFFIGSGEAPSVVKPDDSFVARNTVRSPAPVTQPAQPTPPAHTAEPRISTMPYPKSPSPPVAPAVAAQRPPTITPPPQTVAGQGERSTQKTSPSTASSSWAQAYRDRQQGGSDRPSSSDRQSSDRPSSVASTAPLSPQRGGKGVIVDDAPPPRAAPARRPIEQVAMLPAIAGYDASSAGPPKPSYVLPVMRVAVPKPEPRPQQTPPALPDVPAPTAPKSVAPESINPESVNSESVSPESVAPAAGPAPSTSAASSAQTAAKEPAFTLAFDNRSLAVDTATASGRTRPDASLSTLIAVVRQMATIGDNSHIALRAEGQDINKAQEYAALVRQWLIGAGVSPAHIDVETVAGPRDTVLLDITNS